MNRKALKSFWKKKKEGKKPEKVNESLNIPEKSKRKRRDSFPSSVVPKKT